MATFDFKQCWWKQGQRWTCMKLLRIIHVPEISLKRGMVTPRRQNVSSSHRLHLQFVKTHAVVADPGVATKEMLERSMWTITCDTFNTTTPYPLLGSQRKYQDSISSCLQLFNLLLLFVCHPDTNGLEATGEGTKASWIWVWMPQSCKCEMVRVTHWIGTNCLCICCQRQLSYGRGDPYFRKTITNSWKDNEKHIGHRCKKRSQRSMFFGFDAWTGNGYTGGKG